MPTRNALLPLLAGIAIAASACGGSDNNAAAPAPAAGSPPPTQAPEDPGRGAPAPQSPPASDAPPPADPPVAPVAVEATYRITFTAQWTAENGFGPVPGPAHFSSPVGAAVNNRSQLWEAGQLSSSGLEAVAEAGTTAAFSTEIRDEVSLGLASDPVVFAGTLSDNSSSMDVLFTEAFSLFTFASMVAPSPDWFVGLNLFSMKDPDGQWLDDVTIQLPVYDAGTEEGDTFSGAGAATNPLQPVQRLNGLVAGSLNFSNGLVGGNAIARIRFLRVR